MLTVHHLGKSQSERILWLCEELGVTYEMKKHDRDAVTMLAPPELRALTAMGTAPVITDDSLVLGESGAIVEYILAKYGQGKLKPAVDDANFSKYLHWFHFVNATLQPLMHRNMLLLRRANLPRDNPVAAGTWERLERALGAVEKRLGETAFLAGDDLTAADIMGVFTLSTMRYFMPVDYAPYPNIRAYLHRIGARPAYQRAWGKGDADLAPLLT